jgi:SAM-dependent methyltransferase
VILGQAGPDFYDDETVFANYSARRQRADAPNNTLEYPVLRELLDAPPGKRFVDLGCGDAAIGRELLQRGAASYMGIEGSQRMAALAERTLAGTGGGVMVMGIEKWAAVPESCDVVLSRLALHYVADVGPVVRQVQRALSARGQLVFSVEHPVITSHDNILDGGATRQDWTVDNYFVTGERITQWMGGTVIKYHRTLEDYIRLLREAGLRLEDLREARPQMEHSPDPATYARRMRIPLFLILAARKGE